MKKILKSPFLSALLIGILATALWENFISPLCKYIYINISSFIETFITSFSNGTYRSIANGFNDSNSAYVILIILSTYLGFVINFIIIPIFQKTDNKSHNKIGEDSNQKPKKSSKSILSFKAKIMIFFSIFLLCYIYIIGNVIFVTDCKTKSLCNIEIISPYISDQEYKQLKSNFYSIQTKDDYIEFTETINTIGEEYSLNLKK